MNKANVIAFVEKMFFISKTVGSKDYEPCPWLFLKFFKAGCKLLSFCCMVFSPVLFMSRWLQYLLCILCTVDRGNKVRWQPGQKASLVPTCLNLRSFRSNCMVLKKVSLALLRFSAPPCS